MDQPQFDKDRYLVLKREFAKKLLSPEAYREVEKAVEKIGHTYFVVNLDENEGRSSMETYFSKKFTESPEHCPECGSILAHHGGCLECTNPSCGWAACS